MKIVLFNSFKLLIECQEKVAACKNLKGSEPQGSQWRRKKAFDHTSLLSHHQVWNCHDDITLFNLKNYYLYISATWMRVLSPSALSSNVATFILVFFFILMNRCFEYAWEKEEACEEKWITSVCVVERSIQVRQTMCVNSTFFLCFRGERERCTEVEKRSAKKFLAMARRRKRSPFESVRNKIWEYQCFYIKEIVKCFFFMKSIPIQILNITIWCFCIITFS